MIIMSLYDFCIDPEGANGLTLLLFFTISCFLYPFSVKMVETIALLNTTPQFWQRSLLSKTRGINSLYPLYYLFCLVVAIPMSIVYFVFHWMQEPLTKKR